MKQEILRALSRTYGFSRWSFANEFEFKHELFHQLALPKPDGSSLVSKIPETPSCVLHAEARVSIGDAKKADLLLCDPTRRLRFNYPVEYVIELKMQFSPRTIEEEIVKIESYNRTFAGVFIAAYRPFRGAVPSLARDTGDLNVIDPTRLLGVAESDCIEDCVVDYDATLAVVRQAIDETLLDYGCGRDQFHSFFWCNYEHEIWRGHSFPCEGDFNAHLYHRLRSRLPQGVEIRSEVRPRSCPQKRVDLVVADAEKQWVIPIDVKMNWDQFKPSFKDGAAREPEGTRIIARLAALASEYGVSYPILVVIQNAWQLPRDVRLSALPILDASPCPFEFVAFDEERDEIVHRRYGLRSSK